MRTRFSVVATCILVVLGWASQSLAQVQSPTHAGREPKGEIAKKFEHVERQMHRNMATPLTEDADKDFATRMIPHHQSAIDMAKIALEHGKDPQIRQMAEKMIKDQTEEIQMLKEWVARHGE